MKGFVRAITYCNYNENLRPGLMTSRAPVNPNFRNARAMPCRYQLLATFLTGGGHQLPLIVEDDFTFGQYMRSIRTNLPEGVGS